MAEIKVNPTRMELKKLKARLATSRRGHKLLKDKRDELMKQFLESVREARELRAKLSEQFASVDEKFAKAAAESDSMMLTEALMLPSFVGEIEVSEKNIMSVTVPRFRYNTLGDTAATAYGTAFTSCALDDATQCISEAAGELIRLAELEKTALLLCNEIEKTRRRVNALEYIMIPQLERAIKAIMMKLDENERGNITRLMKVKDMMLDKARSERAASDDDYE